MADKKRLFQPQFKEKWLFGMEPLEPIPLGPHCKHWYKTRDKLPPNDLAKHRNRLLKCPMDSRRWLSLREGLDNFRMGCLPADHWAAYQSFMALGKAFSPRLLIEFPNLPPRKTQNKLPEGAELLSKLSPAQQAQKAFVEEIKTSLTSHPLAGCDLKECLPPDLLLKVLEELDPDTMLEDTWAYCEGMKDGKKSPIGLCEKHPEEINPEPPKPSQPGTSRTKSTRTCQTSQLGTSWPSHPRLS